MNIQANDVSQIKIDGEWLDYARLHDQKDFKALKSDVTRRGEMDRFRIKRWRKTPPDTVPLAEAVWEGGPLAKPKKNPPPLPSTVIPGYGRDYTTKAQAVQSWEDGKDWIIADHFSPWNGKPISIRDFPLGSSVILRYAKLRKTTKYTHGSSGAQRMKKAKKRTSFASKIKTMSLIELEDLGMDLRQKLTKQRPGTPRQKELLKQYLAVSDLLHSRI